MPDPIDELEGFAMPTVDPLPAGEVRRRGDRIRRRNHLLAAAGSLAVVAVLATPFAVLANHSSSSQQPPQPAPHSVDWTTSVPASFDLTAVPAGSPIAFAAQDRPVVDDLEICGKVVFSTGSSSDAAGASWEETASEASMGRTLAVYRDDQRAATALATLRQGIEGCSVDRATGGARLEYTVVSGAPGAADDGFVYSEQVDQGGGLLSDLSVVEVARVGNALFVGTTHGSVGGDQQVAAERSRLADYSDPVLSQMCVFSANPCGGA